VLDLNESLEAVLQMIRRLIGENIELSWKPGRDLRRVRIDPSQLDQMLANLVTNARDAITGAGRVTIETSSATPDESYCTEHPGAVPGRPYVVLSVTDDGHGIERDKLDSIFDPFFTTKEQGKGTGLGLATVYGIVQQNGGFITVYSEPGQGATFRVYLPGVEAKTGEAAEERGPQEPRGGTETILIVEDEAASLSLAQTMLESFGYRVLAAGSPFAAIQLAESGDQTIELLITDVVMPGMNGRQVHDVLAGKRPGLKTLFMSGYPAEVIARQGVLHDGVNFIQKPFTRNELGAKVREILNSPS
jgi:CheY-like chemotaxis protein